MACCYDLYIASLFRVELILTNFAGVENFLVSLSKSFLSSSLPFSPVSAFNSFSIPLWDSTGKFVISEVISSFKEALKH